MFYVKLPVKDKIRIDYPSSYVIKQKNFCEIQKNFECAGFSSAYILRHFNIQTSGLMEYNKIKYKTFSGLVFPKGILKLFEKYNFKATFYRGNIQQLKMRISNGVPVIALIKFLENKNYLHYISVIGYDDENLYLAESLEELINSKETTNYNRIIKIDDFIKLWDINVPFHKCSYFVIEN